MPLEYLNKEYTDPWNRTLYGVNALTSQAYDPFRKALIENFDEGWEKLLKFDWASTRSYLTQEAKYPQSVAHWLETRSSGTGGFDKAFAEVGILIVSIRRATHIQFASRTSLNLSILTIPPRRSTGTVSKEEAMS